MENLGGVGMWMSKSRGAEQAISELNEHHRRSAAAKVQRMIDSGNLLPEEAREAAAKIEELLSGLAEPE